MNNTNTKSDIRVGDKVNIFFEHIEAEFNVTVHYKPVATGDSWYVKREDGTVVSIMHYSKMVVINE